jgi:hypothetical protein
VLKVQAEFGEANTKEEGSVARVGAEVYGTRPDEAGALKLPANGLDDALKALDAVLAPPAPPAPAPSAPAPATVTPEKKP